MSKTETHKTTVPNAENQACPCCNAYRTVMGTVVLKCAVCGDEAFDMADMPYSHLTTSNCMRCGRPCRIGTPDPEARAIVRASKAGFCPSCMIEHFFVGIEALRLTIAKLGPEIFLNSEWREKTLRPIMRGLLAHTQMPEDSINWIEVVGNWGTPWPKGHEPKEMQ